MPSRFIPSLDEASRLRKLRRLKITLVIGEDDPFYGDNAALSQAFAEKKIPHELHVWCEDVHSLSFLAANGAALFVIPPNRTEGELRLR